MIKYRQLSSKKRLFYYDHGESGIFLIAFENQGTNACFFN